jgi:alkylhydroperoxidase family enzyme
MTTRVDSVAAIPWGECLLPPGVLPADLAAEVRRSHGMLPTLVPRFAPLPWLVRALSNLTGAPVASLPIRLLEMVNLVVSRDNSCRYCYGAQRTFMRLLGYEPREIERLEQDELIGLEPSERLALEYARKVSRASPRPGALERAALERAGLSGQAVAELTVVAAVTVFPNRVSTLVALPPGRFDGPAQRLAMRLLRPLLARRLVHRQRAPEPPPASNDGVGAAIVAALGDSPAAGVLRATVDEALGSPVLPRRTKLLMLGVIARALDCRHSERDATAALVAGGMSPRDVEETLAHLASPSLDTREAGLLPFARETVRCQPLEIQARTREVATALELSVEQLLEVVGMTALANTLCRASVLVDPC